MTSGQKENILIVTSDAQINLLLERILRSVGYVVTVSDDQASALNILRTKTPSLAIVADRLKGTNSLNFVSDLLLQFPALPLLLFVSEDKPEQLKRALKLGVSDYLCLPLRSEEIFESIQNSLRKARQTREWVLLEARRATSSLHRQVNELEALARLARTVTSTLELDKVLSGVVEAAVELTGAEEGSLLLLDPDTGELYMRAGKNFQEEFVRTFRLPINDSLAGTVLSTGEPVMLDQTTPQKIKTAYLVHSLAYVPLKLHGHTFGVLGVDNRQSSKPLQDHEMRLMQALAEFAVIAIENARLYQDTNAERLKLETILTRIGDGVIVVDADERLVVMNQVAQDVFKLNMPVTNRPIREIITQSEFIALLDNANSLSNHAELNLEDGRVFAMQATPIREIGLAFTLQDITNLKKLDHIKSDFVSTVSHDLRSPLTAILGYVELLERVGPLNDMQRDFVRRVQVSVHNITTLVDDLLNLGRIEAGFDTRYENVQLNQIIHFTLDTLKKQIGQRGQIISLDLPEPFPAVLANPVQMRQMVENLIENAIKYTPAGGTVHIHAETENSQIILQFTDSGIGIPPLDLPYIFDKFYRASNAGADIAGTGLGLAIVRSILESHHGRIWVDSSLSSGTTFTVVLPLNAG